MGLYLDIGSQFLARRIFQAGRDIVGCGEMHAAVDFKIDRYREPPLDGLHRDVMDGEPAVARDHHDALAHGLVVQRARLGGDGNFRLGDAGLNCPRQPVLDGGNAIERKRAADRDTDIDKQHRARRPGAHPLDSDNPRDTPRDRRHLLADAFRRRVRQTIQGATSQAPGCDANEDRHDNGCRRVGPRIPERDTTQPDQDRDRGPHVGAEMQRIGLECFAGGLPGHTPQRAGPIKVDRDRAGDDGEGAGGRFDGVVLRTDKPPSRLPDHHRGQQKQQRGFGQRAHALDLAVAVLMLGVRGLAGNANGKIGQHRC